MNYTVVIIYCCNRKRELLELLESVFNQTIPPSEVIVISDGPAVELRDLELNINLIESTKFGRPGPLRNEGIERSKNDLIFISDDDDIWHPQKAEFQIRAVNNDVNVGICFTEKLSFSNVSDVREIKFFKKVNSKRIRLRHLLIRNNLPLSSCLINRSIINATFSLSEEVRGWADYDLWLREVKSTKIIKVRAPLLFYRSHSGSMRNGNIQGMIDSQRKLLMTNYDLGIIEKLLVMIFYWLRRIKWRYSNNEY